MYQFLLFLFFSAVFSSESMNATDLFDYFANSWSMIGLRDYQDATRITPENKLVVSDGEVEIRIGEQHRPLSRKQTKRLLGGWLPVILLEAREGSVSYQFKIWATPLPTVRDWEKAFNWPTEGDNYLNWVWIEVANEGSEPEKAHVGIEGDGRDSLDQSFSWILQPSDSSEVVVRIPFHSVSHPSRFENSKVQLWLDRTVTYWEALLNGATSIEVPCQKSNNALRAAHVCQLITSDHGELHCGEGFYDRFYIRDGGYQMMQLEEAGFYEAARTAVSSYLSSQRPDGRFESQENQLDANGQALWTLWQYYLISRDQSWLKRVYPQMRRSADWIMEARRENSSYSVWAGVLPAAPADGEYLWDGDHHIVGYDLWNLRGLLCTASAAKTLGLDEDHGKLLAEAESYRESIDKAWRQTGSTHFPPSWEKEGTHWGNTETLWPTPLFARSDLRLAATVKHAREEHGGGFAEGTIRWLGLPGAIHPYMSSYTTLASLRLDQYEQVVEDFYWYLLHSTAAHAFPEGIFWERRSAWNDTIPHATGASNYAILLRHMLIDEDEGLHLLRAVPDWWLSEGREIRIRNAPTHFGIMSMHVMGKKEGVQLELEAPRRNPPRRIILYLPTARPLINKTEGLEVVFRESQTQPWDFGGLIAEVPDFLKRNEP